jgi:hypothetical protein
MSDPLSPRIAPATGPGEDCSSRDCDNWPMFHFRTRACPAPASPPPEPAEERSRNPFFVLDATAGANVGDPGDRLPAPALPRPEEPATDAEEPCACGRLRYPGEACCAPAPPPSTGGEAPVRCAHGVAICMECAADDYASPRAQTGTPDEGVSEEQLANLERLIAGAWAAPWVAHTFEIDCPCPNGDDCGDTHTCEQVEAPEAYPASPEDPAPAGEGQCVVQISVPGLESLARPNAEFIVAARNALPALIAEVRRLRSAALRREERDARDEGGPCGCDAQVHLVRPGLARCTVCGKSWGSVDASRALSSPATNPEPKE